MTTQRETIEFVAKDNASAVIKSVAAGAAAAGAVVAAAMVKSAKASAEAERSERRLFTAMKLRGGITRTAFDELKRFNSGLESKLGLDADNLAQIQGTLSAQGVANDQLAEATKQTLGLAEVTGSLKTAGQLVAKMYDGNITSLRTYLPGVKSVSQAHEELSNLFGLTEANADDLITKFDILARTLENTQETLGKNVTVNNTLGGATSMLTDVMTVFNANVDSGEGIIMSSVTALSQLNEEILGFSIPGLIGMTNALEDDKKALDAITTGAEAATRAIQEFNKASGFVEFEGDTITSSPEKIKRDAEKRKRAREKKAIERGDSIAIMGQGTLADMTGLGGFDAREFGGSGLGEFSGTPLADYERKQGDIADATKKAKEQEKAREELVKKHRTAVDEMRKANEDLLGSFVQSSAGITEALIQMGISAADGTLSTGDALKALAGVVIQSGIEIMQSLFAQSAAKKAAALGEVTASAATTAATQGEKAGETVPWPASMAVIPAVIAGVLGMFASVIQSFNKGGLVRGGQPGRDSVPALLTPGEFVLTKEVVDDIRAGRGPRKGSRDPGVQAYANGGMVHGGGRFGGQTNIYLSPQINQLAPQSRSDFRRSLLDSVLPAMSDLAQEGITVRSSRVIGRSA